MAIRILAKLISLCTHTHADQMAIRILAKLIIINGISLWTHTHADQNGYKDTVKPVLSDHAWAKKKVVFE